MDSSKDILILAIETSTDVCSVALSRNGQTIDFDIVTEPRMQTSRLAPMVDGLLRRNGIGAKDCAAVAVSSGPGSYTGLRVGVSMAKGLCFGTSLPLIAVNTLDLLAAQGLSMYKSNYGENNVDAVVPMIDARRMEVYQATYDGDGNRTSEIEPKILETFSYSELIAKKRVVFCGNGCKKFEGIAAKGDTFFIECCPEAQYMAQLAFKKFISKNFEDVAYMEPFYLKEFSIGINKKKILG